MWTIEVAAGKVVKAELITFNLGPVYGWADAYDPYYGWIGYHESIYGYAEVYVRQQYLFSVFI